MEDIDDLLDEVETKYVKRPAQPKTNGTPGSEPKPKTRNRVQEKTKTSSAIDAAIDDILDLDLDEECQKDKSKVNSTKSSSVKEANGFGQTRRCLPVYLGGSNVNLGLGSAVNQRACDQLRCTSCDFRVCIFDNMAWKKDTDYLFLRNNVPDFEKLKSKLIKKKGWRAYCCQCCWRNVFDLTETTDTSLKWVCGKHVL
ncbi:protein C8orf37 homolog [Elysia marginata]|uniref:Cilia- and flagella-associated protein 418 n=1 Tax=Elysia marginata TaxID=1093978 RepID=A0AAV4GJE7_9GAST|nr:protein C8orf37 homolog [Elysia marginata]